MKLTTKTFPAVIGFISSRDARPGHRGMRQGSTIQCAESGDHFGYNGSNIVSRRSLLHSTGISLAGIVSASTLAKLSGRQHVDVD